MRFDQVKIIARDLELLADFYTEAIGCQALSPVFELSDEALARGLGAPGNEFRMVWLRLPGHGEEGPTLEIYQVVGSEVLVGWDYQPGQGQLSFQVDDVGPAVEKVIAAGGSMLGEIVDWVSPSGSMATFVYLRDPEGNVVDLWARRE